MTTGPFLGNQGAPQPQPQVGLLSADQRRRTRITGMWAMPLMAFGFSFFALPAVLFVLVVLFALVVGMVGGGTVGALFLGLMGASAGGAVFVANPWLFIVPVVLGSAALIGGSRGSVRALRKAGLRSPRATTWSAFSVGFLVHAAVSGIVNVVVIIITATLDMTAPQLVFGGGKDALLLIQAVLLHSIVLVATVGIGALFWPIFAGIMERRGRAREWAQYQAWLASQAPYAVPQGAGAQPSNQPR